MDKLAEKLRQDAEQIRADISPELDARIRASLESAAEAQAPVGKRRARPRSLWWASSLTGAAVASILILVLNLDKPAEAPTPAGEASIVPLEAVDLKMETAVFTQPLLEELENLGTDLRKAEKAVREEIGLAL